ncbi:vacuolar protein sorting-associated protein 9 [Phytophthora boehmeriae]|uniref:Vacuolar protein sorting-associated protein 9 n=1 Tax=Phytophthora boehmeriae TaxID=109152 RepID=A0A8T1X2A6_9STRA|nr:vacuolar protein sorting-associated protein 9 [Phytophthora boehmeriae]
MMFWGRSSSTKAAATSATEHVSSSRRAFRNAEIQAVATVPVAPSYMLSEQRRSELLMAARTNRVSWVDGVEERHTKALLADRSDLPGTLAASSIPSHCREALEGVSAELSRFFTSLEVLKSKILANNINLSEEGSESDSGTQAGTSRYCSLFQELREQETLLDQWQRSHSPRTRRLTGHDREMTFLVAFRELVMLLKDAQAAELVYRIQSFVKRAEQWDLPQMLRARATRDRPGGRIQSFVTKLVEQIKHNRKLTKLLHGDGSDGLQRFLHVHDESGDDLVHEVLEAFLMEKLYKKMLTPSSEMATKDNALHDRINLLGFVTFKHLDLPVPKTEEQEQTWIRLADQLKAMTLCPSPRRKMDGVLSVCQELTMLLKAQNGGRFPSADEFLPALIFVLLRANPKELKRNVAYILEYRNPAKLVSEPGYFFTHLVSSVAFLEEVNGSLLTISAEEFDEGLKRSKESLKLRAVNSEMDNEVISDASMNEELPNEAAKALQNERHGLMVPHPSSSITTEETDEPLRLPNVLEIRAKRLAQVSSSK